MEQFKQIKEEILRKAKEAKACVGEYKRALEAQSLQELAQVIKDNFTWCCDKRVLDVAIIEKYKAEFASVEIYANQSISSGYVVIDGEVEELSGNSIAFMLGNSTVNEMWDNATVNEMWDNSTVKYMCGNSTVNKMCGNATVNKMCGNATVKYMCDNSTVTKMWDNAYISTYNYIECKINDNAIMRVRSENKIYTNVISEKPKS